MSRPSGTADPFSIACTLPRDSTAKAATLFPNQGLRDHFGNCEVHDLHSTVKKESANDSAPGPLHEQNKPVEWRRVYRLPDYVFFQPKEHNKAGATCETCHGPVPERDALRKEKTSPWLLAWNAIGEAGFARLQLLSRPEIAQS